MVMFSMWYWFHTCKVSITEIRCWDGLCVLVVFSVLISKYLLYGHQKSQKGKKKSTNDNLDIEIGIWPLGLTKGLIKETINLF